MVIKIFLKRLLEDLVKFKNTLKFNHLEKTNK